ncbi:MULTISPECIES: hypothetical protein [Nostocales]|uniref:Uncharacterized protein n=3 Tax=Nostocales TaxID=1161 RepID=A0A0C1RAT8_9CYAN|nr:hypothetical protein [Tolypothrix bouteillei]KAF3884804.1 hypothetical protein DA73_0400004575 [Tolypothrix bouteillei VB521301]
MVERPIKKSERQSNTNTDNNSEDLDSTPPVESNPKSIKRNSDRRADSSERRSSGRGKKSYGNESKPPVNPALARGPKPVKAKPNVVVEPEVEAESVSEEAQDQATAS